ncbi:MAG TPA: hypothetical protein PLZ36_13510, partial [Armatimonadota bacterium]|nr:hypothetical protein [Armatimonadota bacterium]
MRAMVSVPFGPESFVGTVFPRESSAPLPAGEEIDGEMAIFSPRTVTAVRGVPAPARAFYRRGHPDVMAKTVFSEPAGDDIMT